MVNGAVEAISSRETNPIIKVLTPKNCPIEFSFFKSVENIRTLSDWTRASQILASMQDAKQLFVLGADILDGHYSVPDACNRVMLARKAAELGIATRIVGFSLNALPSAIVLREFNKLNGLVPLFLRDEFSFDRAQKLIDGDIRLSADVAFLLHAEESERTQGAQEFIGAARRAGKRVMGVNLHNLYSRTIGQKAVQEIAKNLAGYIEKELDHSFVLIPHDFREYIDDRVPLNWIFENLTASAKSRVFFLRDPMRAGEIKKIASMLDFLITGRMHLAIAALDSGVPVFGVVYQGKFEGTFAHFGLDADCSIEPLRACEPEKLEKSISFWIRNEVWNRSKIEGNIRKVRSLALSNFNN
jgi:colanic acid/amylovoran biosynthesis protein